MFPKGAAGERSVGFAACGYGRDGEAPLRAMRGRLSPARTLVAPISRPVVTIGGLLLAISVRLSPARVLVAPIS